MTTTFKTLQQTVFASLLLVAVAACSSVTPVTQVSASDLAAQNAVVQGD
ncbi:MAG: hypothetical protein WDN69_11710 [Aliidongia sp.]